MGFCSCSVKYLLFLFNFLIVLGGILIITVGVLATSNGSSLKSVMRGEIMYPSIALIVLGAIVFLIAFMGCCGAIRDSSCMLTTYSLFLMTIVVLEVIVGVTIFVNRSKIPTTLETATSNLFGDYRVDEVTREAVDEIQKNLKCCGTDGPNYWISTSVPPSCCKDPTEKYPCHTWSEGCTRKIIEGAQTVSQQLGTASIVVACIEIVGIVFGLFLASSIRRQLQRGYV